MNNAEIKHSPAPWKIAELTEQHPSPRIFSGSRLVAHVSNSDYPNEANANLIAAAPDMLEALQNLENDDGKTMPPSAWKLVQNAITKATNGV